jgi:hypothetical protein
MQYLCSHWKELEWYSIHNLFQGRWSYMQHVSVRRWKTPRLQDEGFVSSLRTLWHSGYRTDRLQYRNPLAHESASPQDATLQNYSSLTRDKLKQQWDSRTAHRGNIELNTALKRQFTTSSKCKPLLYVARDCARNGHTCQNVLYCLQVLKSRRPNTRILNNHFVPLMTHSTNWSKSHKYISYYRRKRSEVSPFSDTWSGCRYLG